MSNEYVNQTPAPKLTSTIQDLKPELNKNHVAPPMTHTLDTSTTEFKNIAVLALVGAGLIGIGVVIGATSRVFLKK